MIIENAKYNKNIADENCSVQATIDGRTMSVPLDTNNTDYAEILKQVADGDITIAEAD
tara:strand:+ start:911 stop:1084 length:174 start_codon:yes stop_codon:yes gene_type:complete